MNYCLAPSYPIPTLYLPYTFLALPYFTNLQNRSYEVLGEPTL